MGFKEEQIKKAIERREKSIKQFSDLKSVSIAVSSCFNGAIELCNILVSAGRPLIGSEGQMDEYWKMHDLFYLQMLDRFSEAQDQGRQDYTRKEGEKTAHGVYMRDKHSEAKDNAGLDFSS